MNPITAMVTAAGRGVLGRVLHVDLERVAARVSDAAARNVGESAHVVARGAVRWVSLFTRNFEMTLYWGLLWMCTHLLVVVLGGEVLWAHRAVPAAVVIPAEVLPGGLFLVSILRLVVAMARVRRMDIFAGAPAPPALGPAGPPRGWLLVRLLQPTDVDVAVVVLLVAVLEVLFAR